MKAVNYSGFFQRSKGHLNADYMRKLQVAICLAVAAFLSYSINLPLKAEACGWWGDASHDDSDDSILVDSEGNPVPVLDEVEVIIDPDAQTKIGNRHRTGDGVARDYTKAVYWYRKAAEQGYSGAQNNLAVMYEQGLGVSKNKSEAAKWFRKAAEQKDAYAQHSLGILYRDGEGVPQNLAEAAKWIRRAAEQSHHTAFRDMGEIYWKGLGVSQSNVRAYMWWKLSALHGDKESEMSLDRAAAKMTSNSVNEAEKMARDWMQKN
jgi:TPR repeat protein